jgi:hypothetical protein
MSWSQRQLEELKPRYPGWDIWLVKTYPNQVTWCARPKGTLVSTIRVLSPEDLIEAIALAG